MSNHEPGEPLQSVLAAARAVDPDFTEVTLKKWRDGGLVPRPQARPGRGRKGDKQGGRDAIYPVGTSNQLQRLLELRAAAREVGTRFRPERALWHVWWGGGYGSPDTIRDQLRQQAAELVQSVESISHRMGAESNSDGATTVFDDAARGSIGAGLASARERTGKNTFPTLLYFLFNLARGSFPGFKDDDPGDRARGSTDLDDRRIFARGMGLDRARLDQPGTGEPWLQGSLDAQLDDLASLASPDAVENALQLTSHEELEAARDELQALIGILFSLRLTLENMHGPGAFGLTGAPHPDDLDESGQRHLLVWWLALRLRPQLRDGYRLITGIAGAVAPMETFIDVTRSAATRQLPRQLPQQGATDTEGQTS